jgi:hypothetical protein
VAQHPGEEGSTGHYCTKHSLFVLDAFFSQYNDWNDHLSGLYILQCNKTNRTEVQIFVEEFVVLFYIFAGSAYILRFHS